jgi:hypothetical protein
MRTLANLHLADAPVGLDKYDLRMLLVGKAVLRGASYQELSGCAGVLHLDGERLAVEIVDRGLRLGDHVMPTSC